MQKLAYFNFLYAIICLFSCVINLQALDYQYSTGGHLVTHLSGVKSKMVYSVELSRVDEFLPQKFKVSKNAKRAARFTAKKFSPLRAPIYLVNKKLIPRLDHRSQTKTDYDFFSSLKIHQHYTYVILKNHFIFTECANHPLVEKGKDLASKHLLLARLHKQVNYAGEFALYRNKDNQLILMINNGSGTFQPSDGTLKNLQELLTNNFPSTHNFKVQSASFQENFPF